MFKIVRFIVIAIVLAIAVGAAFQFFDPKGEPPAAGQSSGWMQR